MRPVVIGGDHSISYPVVRAVSEKLGGPVDILHLDAHPDIYDRFEGNYYSHASSFARIMEGGYARRLLQVLPFRSAFFLDPDVSEKNIRGGSLNAICL